MILRPWLAGLMAPVGLLLGSAAMHYGREPGRWPLPFALPSLTWPPHAQIASPPAGPVSPVTAGIPAKLLGVSELRTLLGRCRPPGAGEVLPPSDLERSAGASRCAAAWAGGDPVRVLRVLDQELERLAATHGYRWDAGSSFSGGTAEYTLLHARRSLTSATGTTAVDIWLVRGADAVVTLIVHVGDGGG